MRTEQQMWQLILGYAEKNDKIRVVTLEGSRTNVNIPKDDFQDYDITFLVTDMEAFTRDDAWLSVFGNRIMMQKPEDMELFPTEEPGFSYLMLFDDDIKIDLTLLPVERLEEYLTWDKLVRVLLDKDGRIQNPPVPTDEDYRLRKPTERMVDDCCNEFWNVTTYVVKGLCRHEILFAIDHMHEIMRKELLRMMGYWVGTEHGFTFSVGKNSKFLDHYVPAAWWQRLMQTYRMDSYEHMWEALLTCMALFRDVSRQVTQRLDYAYPPYDAAISAYVERHKPESLCQS